jgi:hypothetical protein
MAGQAGLTELAAGSVLLLAGTEWTVTAVEAQRGRVMLASGGEERWRSIRWLVHHPDCQPVPGDVPVPARLAGQPPVLDDLSDYQRKILWLRVGHLLEAETGFRSGDPLHPAPGEPLLRTVKQAINDHGSKVLAIDDATRLKLHREADQDVLDLLRELMSMSVTLILIGVGIPRSGLLRDGRRDPATGQWIIPPVKDRGKSRNDDAPGQTDLRFEMTDLDRFSYGGAASTKAWIAHLVGLEQQLRLLNARDGMLSDGDMPEYLFRHTRGTVGILRKLIQKACRRAIETGEEEITTALLDTLTITRRDLPGLDPGSGEISGFLAAPDTEKPAKPRKHRNTVFDDHGAPAAGTAG